MKISENFKYSIIRTILIVIFVYIIVHIFYISGLLKEREELNENIKFWGIDTVNFFNDFNINNLSRNNNLVVNIDKIFIIDTHLRDNVKWNINYKKKDYADIFGDKYTKDIKEANVVVWYRTIKGKKSGIRYSNGESVYRLNTELNFIEKKTNVIFKSKTFLHEGQPKKSIKFSYRNSRDYNKEKQKRIKEGEHNIYFGKRPKKIINQFVLSQFNNN